MDKKKIFAIALFFIMGFFMFTNANPADETREIKGENNNTTIEVPEDNNDTTEVIDENNDQDETTTEEDVTDVPVTEIIVNQKPIITLNGGNMILRVSDDFHYEELGVTIIDPEDGDISTDVIISGEVLNEKGIYTISYDITDSEGLSADTVARTVEVVDTTELEDSISLGNEILNLTSGKELNEDLKGLIDELKNAISDGNYALENENSTQDIIDEVERIIDEILEKIQNLEFVVKFNINNVLVKEFTVKFNESVSEKEVSKINTNKKGYTFTGWNGNFTNVMKNEEVNGYNEVIDYNITYILDNKEYKQETFNVENVKELVNYEKQGYTCSSWLNNNEVITSTEGIYSDITVYSNCSADKDTKYKVIVKKQNLDASYTNNEYELIGETDSLIDIETLKAKYLEDGFEYSNHTTNSSTVLASGETVITLIYNRSSYELSFESIGSSVETQEYKHGEIVNLSSYTSTKQGYKFIGWSLNGTLVDEVTMDSNKQLKAEFDIIEYSITYDLNNGTLKNENPLKYTVEDKIVFNQPSKEGYKFIGWYLNDEVLNTKVTSIEKGSVGDLSLIAIYEIKTYTVNFYNGEELISAQTVKHNDSAIAPETPIKDNYTFTGWSTEFNNVKTDINVYATYSANQIGIEVELNTNAQLQFEKGSNVDITDYIKVYKVFADGSKKETTDYTTDLSTANVVDHKTLNITQGTFTNNELKYSVINEQAFQTKFEVVYKENEYRKTKNEYCTNNCDSKEKTSAVGLQNSVLEIIEHYDELIEIKEVIATYADGTKKLSVTDNSVRWSHVRTDGWYGTSRIYNPVYIATLKETEVYTEKVCKNHKKCEEVQKTREVTVDVMNEEKIINTVSIKYERSFGGYSKKYVVVFANNNGIFTAIDEYEI